jgi:hypothetical protein
MSDLTSIERLKLQKLFEMDGGYVLDFSNRTFQEFILESVNIDIYNQKYSYYSGSKANRLRAFWIKEPNPIVGTLIDKLLDYWKEKRLIANQQNTLQEEVLYKSCKQIASRLKGEVKEDNNDIFQQDGFIPQRKSLFNIFEEFASLSSSGDKRRRGFLLEDLLNKTFKLYGIQTVKSFRRNEGGEQIDGAFMLNGWHYIVECKWTEGLSDISQLDSLYGKLNRSGKQTMGLFLSINGWSNNVINLLKQNQDKSIVLMDGYDLRCVLSEHTNVSLRELILKKLSHLNFDSEPFYSVSRFINEVNNC